MRRPSVDGFIIARTDTRRNGSNGSIMPRFRRQNAEILDSFAKFAVFLSTIFSAKTQKIYPFAHSTRRADRPHPPKKFSFFSRTPLTNPIGCAIIIPTYRVGSKKKFDAKEAGAYAQSISPADAMYHLPCPPRHGNAGLSVSLRFLNSPIF